MVICARRADVLERAASEIRKETGGDVTGVQADVSVSEQIDRLFDAITETYDGLDILVNNAGRHMSGHFMEMTDAQWYADLDLKLMAAIRCSRLAVPMMRRRGGGRIINITTPLGKAPSAGSVPTSVSRAAGIALTKAMSYDLADDNILVNTVCIGHVKSAQMERVPSREGNVAGGALRCPGEERAPGPCGGDPGGGRPHRLSGVGEGQLHHGLRHSTSTAGFSAVV